MPLEYDCPVCANRARLYDVVDFNKSCEESNGLFLPLSGTPVYYALCSHCGFLFAPEFQDWSREDFLTKIYNDDYIVVDPDFEKKRPEESAAMLHKLFGDHKKKFRHLDFGGGDGEMSRRLRERGWDSQSWDPFFDPASSLNGEKFDLISDGRNEEARAGLKYKSSLVLLLCGFVFTRAPAAPATGVCGLQH